MNFTKLFLVFSFLLPVVLVADEIKCPPDTMLIDFVLSYSQERMQVCQKKVNGKFVKHGPEIIYNKDGSVKEKRHYDMDVVVNLAPEDQKIIPAPEKGTGGSACLENFISVPKMLPYTTKDFCIAKYEMKNDGSGKAVSQAKGKPWGYIKRADAILKCAELGPGYAIVTNNQWQTIARNIAKVATNWSGGAVASGQLNRGHFSLSENNHEGIEALEETTGEVWSDQRRTHKLTNGAIIWDFSGNLTEFVSDNNESNMTFVNDLKRMHERKSECEDNRHLPLYKEAQVSTLNCGDILQEKYGADSETICKASNKNPPYCGMGLAHLVGPVESALRGGATSGSAGVFAVGLNTYEFSPVSYIGFRCAKN